MERRGGFDDGDVKYEIDTHICRSGRRALLAPYHAAGRRRCRCRLSHVVPPAGCQGRGDQRSTLTFPELTKIYDQTHHVAAGYDADVLVRWGEAILSGGTELDAASQSADSQAKQFGYNCDFIGYLPLPLGLEQQRSRPALRQQRISRSAHHVPRA